MCRRVARSRRRWNKVPCECALTTLPRRVCHLSQRLRDTLLDVTQRLAGHRRAMAWEEEARRPCPASSRCETNSTPTTTGVTGQRGAVLRSDHRLRVAYAGRGVLRPAHGKNSVTRLQQCSCSDAASCTGHRHRPTTRLHAATAAADDPRDGGAVRAAKRTVRGPADVTLSHHVTDTALCRRLAASWSPPAGTDPCPPARADPDASAIAASASAVVAAWRQRLRVALPRLAEPLALAARAHLALFYLYGVYLTPAHRVAGVRRIFIGQRVEPRIHYGVLGVLLAAQVAVQCAQLAVRSTAQTAAMAQGGQRGHAVVMVREPSCIGGAILIHD